MENWSPQTKLRVGLSTLDDNGNIVSIWNFGDWGETLNDIDTVGLSEGVQSQRPVNVEVGSSNVEDHSPDGLGVTVYEPEDTTGSDVDQLSRKHDMRCYGSAEEEQPPLLGPEIDTGENDGMPDLEVCPVTNFHRDFCRGISAAEDMQLQELSLQGLGESDSMDYANCPICVVDNYEGIGRYTSPIGFERHVPLTSRLQELYHNPHFASLMAIDSRHGDEVLPTNDDGDDPLQRCSPATERPLWHRPHMDRRNDADRLRVACNDVAAAVLLIHGLSLTFTFSEQTEADLVDFIFSRFLHSLEAE